MSEYKTGPTIEDIIETKEVVLCGCPIRVEIAPLGAKIPILARLENPDHYRGPAEFDAVVDFGGLFVSLNMRGQHVSSELQWSAENLPPEGIKILEFFNPDVANCTQEISEIATFDFYDNRDACRRYFLLNQKVFLAIARNFGLRLLDKTYFLGLIRAGVVAGEMLMIPYKDQVKIQTKRLHLKGEKEGNIAVGITYLNPEQIKTLHEKEMLIADPAGATFSSIMGNLVYLVQQEIRPGKVEIWNTVASHRGSLFALEAMKNLGIQGEIVAGGYSPGMNGRYYLETKDRRPSVRDAGDGLDRFLPEELRLLNKS